MRRWDAEGLAVVGRGIRASVATGENLTGLEQYRPLLAAGAVDIVQTAAVWGVTHFLRVAALAHAHDLPVSPIGTTPVGAAARRDVGAQPHRQRAAGPAARRSGCTLDLHVEDGAFVLGDSPGPRASRIDEDAIIALDGRARAHAVSGPHIRPPRAGHRLVTGSG